MDYNKLSELLFPEALKSVEKIMEEYPRRTLKEGEKVTRMAPSPTGFMHLGNLYAALTNERLAHISGGIFYLRIEDTDKKREVEGGVEAIINALYDFGLEFDEGVTLDGEKGIYGPYKQRQREKIYKAFAKKLVSEGKAYPCFCTEEDLAELHKKQEEAKEDNPGYRGKWAKCRNLTYEEIEEKVKSGLSYVIRLKSMGNIENKFKFTDLVKGDIEVCENDMDIVILKSDGIPTYHFAHVIDDYLMGTTHVVRGDEWLATLPVHLQLFRETGLKPPKYMHISPLMKMDGETKRKLSKRKDPELALSYYKQEGYVPECVLIYLMTLLNSNFEEWYDKNHDKSYKEFPFSPKKMSVSGALFDLVKLNDVSKNYISRLSAEEVYNLTLSYAEKYDTEFYEFLKAHKDKTIEILNIGRGGNKPRKDIARLTEVKDYISYFFSELYNPSYDFPSEVSEEDRKNILRDYISVYDEKDDNSAWFSKIKEISEKYGYTVNMKEYKKNPDGFKGNISHVSTVIRVAVCGRVNTPDMYDVLRIMGKALVKERLEKWI